MSSTVDPPQSCTVAREWISASIDGEEVPADSDWVEGHVQRCADWAAWRQTANRLARTVRISNATDMPVPSSEFKTLLAAELPRRRWRPISILRASLAILALAQAAASLQQLLSGHMDGRHDLGAL